MTKTAIITGITGQDGAFLSRILIHSGYQVVGTTRCLTPSSLWRLKALGIENQVIIEQVDYQSTMQIASLFKRYPPSLIFHLSGMSSVSESFKNVEECIDSIVTSTIKILDQIRSMNTMQPKLIYAASSECFGDHGDVPITEETQFKPISPYAVAKVSAVELIKTYRLAYGVNCSIGFLFNHESKFRGTNFVTQKICTTAEKISKHELTKLELANTSIIRDWGYAAEHMEAMLQIGLEQRCDDYIIATGKSYSLECLAQAIFERRGLDYREYLQVKALSNRPTDIIQNYANPSKINTKIGWKAKTNLSVLSAKLVDPETW